jgi:hypothetical protein
MASREVKPAMSSKAPERGSWPGKGATVKPAMTPPKEERPKKETRKVKRAMKSGR